MIRDAVGRIMRAEPIAFPAYRVLWLANSSSNIAVLIQIVAASWMMVTLGTSAQSVALVQTASGVPLLLTSPLAGSLTDTIDRRAVMIASQFGLAAIAAVLAALVATGLATPFSILACIFLAGCMLAFNGPAFMASVADVVPRENLPDAVVLNAIGLNIARTVGPALGGALVASLEADISFIVSMAISLALGLVLLRSRSMFAPSAGQRPVPGRAGKASMREGIKRAASIAPIRNVLLRSLLFATAFSGLQALMPLIASQLLSGGPDLFGQLFASYGAGAIGGALVTSKVRKRMGRKAAVRLCTITSAAALAAIALAPSIIMAFAAIATAGAAWVIGFSIFNVSIQLGAPGGYEGRMLAFYQMSVFGGISVGSWVAGFASDHFGVPGGLTASAALGAVTLAAGFLLPLDAGAGRAKSPDRQADHSVQHEF